MITHLKRLQGLNEPINIREVSSTSQETHGCLLLTVVTMQRLPLYLQHFISLKSFVANMARCSSLTELACEYTSVS